MSNIHSDEDQTDWQAIKKYAVMLVGVGIAVGGVAFWKNKDKAPTEPAVAASKPAKASRESAPTTGKRPSVTSTFKLTIPEGSVTEDSVRHHVRDWLLKKTCRSKA